MGRKTRSWATQPGRCFAFFSLARSSKRRAASVAAAERWEGRRGQEMVTSMAVVGG